MERAQAYPQEELGNAEIEVSLALAQEHDARARELDSLLACTWSEIGLLAMTVDRRREWELLKFRSFEAWLCDAFAKSRSYVFGALQAVKGLPELSAETLRDIPLSTAHVLRKLPKKMRADPEIIANAKTMTPKNFIAHIKTEAPNLHIDFVVGRKYRFTETQSTSIDAAIEMVQLLQGEQMSPEECLESVCIEYLVDHRIEYERRKKHS
jgi:hypothetical protein